MDLRSIIISNGCSFFDPAKDNIDAFLRQVDERRYEMKARNHRQ